MTGPGVKLLVALLKAVGQLALTANVQIVFLRERGLPIDELALGYHDGAVLVSQFVANDWLTPSEGAEIDKIDELLDGMSGQDKAQLWTEQALEESPEWEAVRSRAREMLGR